MRLIGLVFLAGALAGTDAAAQGVVKLPPIGKQPPPVKASVPVPQPAATVSTVSASQPAAAPAPEPAPAAPAARPVAVAQAPAAAPVAEAAAPAVRKSVKIPEGTELKVRFNEKLSSSTNKEGDEFSVTLDDKVTLADGTVIRDGYRGKGEVTAAHKKGMMGQAGDLNIRLNYIRIGDTRVRIRGQKGKEGDTAITSTVILTVLFGPLGLIKHGHDVDIPRGQTFSAFVDSDAEVSLPLAPPPEE